MKTIFLAISILLSFNINSQKILVFTKTAGYKHASIQKGAQAIMQLGKENNFKVDTTSNANSFTTENLSKYSAIVFLNTTGDVFNQDQQSAFESYIQAGGGFVGIHAATDTEYDWPWYNKLVGAYFESHPHVQEAKILITDHDHPSTSFMEDSWLRTDEWYNFKSMNPNVSVLMKLDTDSYEGSTLKGNHPIAWYHDYDGGKAFYTGLGHTIEGFGDPMFLKHLLGGIKYTSGLD